MSRRKSTEGNIFISYSPQRRKDSVRKLADNLKENNYTVWLDTTGMTSTMQTDLAHQGMEAADAVIICVSDDYKNLKNCQNEAEFASKHKKLILPLRMQKDFQASGWLGFVLGDRPFIDFTEDSQLDRIVMTIEQRIQEHLKSK